MNVKFIYDEDNRRLKKVLKLISYDSKVWGGEVWVVFVYDYQFYYDEGYQEILNEEFFHESEAMELFARKMNEYEMYRK